MSDDERRPGHDWTGEWPLALSGVTESVVATLGPNDRWNLAALGLHAPDHRDVPGAEGRVTARTWGRTRTRRNFAERGGGVVQFTRDPRLFVEAALGIEEREDPVAEAAVAHVDCEVERLDDGERGSTEWVDWALSPRRVVVHDRAIPTTDRGHAAVVEATVAASRLDVPAYDTDRLVGVLDYLSEVVVAAGSDREQSAFERIDELTGWRERREG